MSKGGSMYDLIIIGSGPAGLSAAVYGARAGLNLMVIEKNAISGGQVLNTYEVDNYLGMPSMNGFDMGMQFRAHADKLGVTFENAKVLSIEDKHNFKIVHTRKKDFDTRALIVATGAEHAKLGVDGEERLSGRGVSYCATCDGAFYRGKVVAVVGGGDVALEDAIYLSRACEKVYLIHRRDEFRGARVLQDEVKAQKNVEILYHHEVKEICGEDLVESICVINNETEEMQEVAVSGIFIAVGIHPDTSLLDGIVERNEQGYVLAGEDCISSCDGIYVAGDIRSKALRQIVTAVADGANAIVSVEKYLNGYIV